MREIAECRHHKPFVHVPLSFLERLDACWVNHGCAVIVNPNSLPLLSKSALLGPQYRGRFLSMREIAECRHHKPFGHVPLSFLECLEACWVNHGRAVIVNPNSPPVLSKSALLAPVSWEVSQHA